MARAHSEYSAPDAKKAWFFSFYSDIRFGARRARKCARAKNFSWKCNLHYKISLQFFLFGHNLKSEVFRAIWSLNFFLKNRFFSKILKILKMLGKSMEKVIFRWKKSNYDELQRNVFWWVLGLQIWLRHQKTSISFELFILKNYITARALPRALWTLEYSTYCARQILMDVNITRAQYVEYSSVHSARGSVRAVI